MELKLDWEVWTEKKSWWKELLEKVNIVWMGGEEGRIRDQRQDPADSNCLSSIIHQTAVL